MTIEAGWSGSVSPGLVTAQAPKAAPDPLQVQRFNEAMVPQAQPVQSAGAIQPVEDLYGLPRATDSQLARLPRAQLERLQARWGSNDDALRVEAKVTLDLIEKPIQQAILKEIRKGFGRRDD